MTYKKFLLLMLITMVLMVSAPTFAQTTEDVLANANGEAVQVISSGLVDAVKLIGGMLVSVIAIYALALYRSSPPIAQKVIAENGQKAIEAIERYTDKTINKIDDKLADVAGVIFNAVMQMIEDEQDEDETAPILPPTPPNDTVQ